MTAAQSSAMLLALHALRLKGFAGTGEIALVFLQDGSEIDRLLAEAAEADFVVRRDGTRAGWALTPAGRAEGERLLSDEIAAVGCQSEIHDSYEDFLELNSKMLAVCTRWQVKDADALVLNDHTDAEYDAGVVAELGTIHNRVGPICSRLAGHLQRFGIYLPRFESAIGQLWAGDLDWFTKPVVDSYHTVWFELHEDLLSSLGLERAAERAGE